MNLRWFDPILIVLAGFAIGGFIYVSVPCVYYGGTAENCLGWGVVGSLSAFHDWQVWIKDSNDGMMYCVGGCTAIIFLVVIYLRESRKCGLQDRLRQGH